MSRATLKDLKSVYDIEKTCLGSGRFGKVFKATNLKDQSIQVAIKVINKYGMADSEIKMLKNEVSLMQQVDHPNIVKYYETFNDTKYIYLVMELFTGGDLFQSIDKGRALTEREASMQMFKCLKALQHCHGQNIIHRDLKPQNIMFASDGEIKLIDFGFAFIQRNQQAGMKIAGTPYYVAPEVLTGVYGKECDIWSMGVCLYQMVTGELPFDGTSKSQIFRRISRGQFEIPDGLSDSCKDLLKKMIKVDTLRRYSCKQCIEHPFIREGEKLTKSMSSVAAMTQDQVIALNKEVIENLKKYRGKSVLRGAAMNVFVKHLQPASIEKLKQEFEKLDTDNSGFLEAKELKQAIKKADKNMTSEEINGIIDNIDYARNRKINYSEFIAATINVSKYLTDDKLEAIFKTFDIDHSGRITPENLKLAFSKFGREISSNDIATIMKEHDIDDEGKISEEQFTVFLMKKNVDGAAGFSDAQLLFDYFINHIFI